MIITIKKDIKKLANPSKAKFLVGYMKTSYPILGLTVPQMRQIAQKYIKGKTFDEMFPIIDSLLKGKTFEEVSIGLYMLSQYHEEFSQAESTYWNYLERFIPFVDNWCHSDISCGLRNLLFKKNPARIKDLRKWVTDKNPWKRRAGLITLVSWSKGFRVHASLEDALWMTEKTIDDKHFYVQRAVGWVLRDLSEKYPAEVFAYLKKNNHRMAAITRTTALEKLKKKGYALVP